MMILKNNKARHLLRVLIALLLVYLISCFFFHNRVDLAFKKKVIPLLKASQHYFSTLIDCLLDASVDCQQQVHQALMQVENAFTTLPAWIYKPGFDLALQKGYRYYFMQLDH